MLHVASRPTGMDYMVARYYSSSLGRFMAVDPAASAVPEDPQSWNRYTYAANNPLRFIDPFGLYKVKGDEAAKAKLNEQTSDAIGMNVYEDENGDMQRAAGPPAPGDEAAVAAFDAAAGADFTINAVSESEFVIDRFDTQQVNPNHIGALPTSASGQGVTQGEVVTHILAEYTAAANGLGFQGQAAFNAAHAAGTTAQNQYRAGQGQSPIVDATTRAGLNWGVGWLIGSRSTATWYTASGNSTRMTVRGPGLLTSGGVAVENR